MVSLAVSDVSIGISFGGEQVISSELYFGLKAKYKECYPINIIVKKGVLNQAFIGPVIPILKSKNASRVISYILRRAKLINLFSRILIRKFQSVDILISNNPMDFLLSRRLSFKNLIIIKHDPVDIPTRAGKSYLKRVDFLVKKSSKYRLVALNKKDYNDLVKIFGIDKVKLIYNGVLYNDDIPTVDLVALNKKDFKNKFVILSLGRLQESQKQISKLILAASKLRNKDFIIIIAGNGPDKDYYTKLTESIGLSDKVIFTGFVPDDVKISLYKIADVFVQPSQNESFGLTTLEAMHYGSIVLTIRNKGSIEIIDDKKNGLFIKADPTDIAEKINWIASLKESKRNTLKQNAIERSKDFSYDKMLLEYTKVIDSFF